MKIIVIDTETGGLDPLRHSILTIAGVLIDTDAEDGALFPLFDLTICEDTIHAEEEALQVNGIDLAAVRELGWAPEAAAQQIADAVHDVLGGEGKPILAGHNVGFDVGFARRLFRLGGVDYPFSHRTMDTSTIIRFLRLAGLYEGDGGSSTSMFEVLGVTPPERDRHTAMGDAMATAKAFLSMLREVRRIVGASS